MFELALMHFTLLYTSHSHILYILSYIFSWAYFWHCWMGLDQLHY